MSLIPYETSQIDVDVMLAPPAPDGSRFFFFPKQDPIKVHFLTGDGNYRIFYNSPYFRPLKSMAGEVKPILVQYLLSLALYGVFFASTSLYDFC